MLLDYIAIIDQQECYCGSIYLYVMRDMAS